MGSNDAPIRAVIDSNVLVSGMISAGGNPAAILRAWRNDAFVLVFSHQQHVELQDVFSRPAIVRRFRPESTEVEELFALLETKAQQPAAYPSLPVQVRDPKDNHILAAALGGSVEYLVTGDQDLLALAGDSRLGALQIVTAREFREKLPLAPESK